MAEETQHSYALPCPTLVLGMRTMDVSTTCHFITTSLTILKSISVLRIESLQILYSVGGPGEYGLCWL